MKFILKKGNFKHQSKIIHHEKKYANSCLAVIYGFL